MKDQIKWLLLLQKTSCIVKICRTREREQEGSRFLQISPNFWVFLKTKFSSRNSRGKKFKYLFPFLKNWYGKMWFQQVLRTNFGQKIGQKILENFLIHSIHFKRVPKCSSKMSFFQKIRGVRYLALWDNLVSTLFTSLCSGMRMTNDSQTKKKNLWWTLLTIC